jgi:hypothetical protein
VADNSRKITLNLDTTSADADLKKFLDSIPATVSTKLQFQTPTGTTSNAGYTGVGPGHVAPGAPGVPNVMGNGQFNPGAGGGGGGGGVPAPPDLTGMNSQQQKMAMQAYKAQLEAGYVKLTAALNAEADARSQAAAKLKQAGTADVQNARAKLEEQKLVGKKEALDQAVAAQKAIADYKLQGRREYRDEGAELKKQGRKEREERAALQRFERNEAQSRYGKRLVDFERARLMSGAVGPAVDTLMSGQVSAPLRLASQGIGVYQQYQALGYRHDLREQRRAESMAAGGAGVSGSSGAGALGDAAGGVGGAAAAGAAGGPPGMVAAMVAQVMLSAMAKMMDMAQSQAAKTGSVMNRRATMRELGSRVISSTFTEQDSVARSAAMWGIGPDADSEMRLGLAKSVGNAGVSDKLAPHLAAMQGIGVGTSGIHALGRAARSYGQVADPRILLGTAKLSGVTGERINEGFQTLAGAQETMAGQGYGTNANAMAAFGQRLQGNGLSFERSNTMAAQFETRGIGALDQYRNAMKQYNDAKLLSKAMVGANSMLDVDKNYRAMTGQQRYEALADGSSMAAHSLYGEGFSSTELPGLGNKLGEDVMLRNVKRDPAANPDRAPSVIDATAEQQAFESMQKAAAEITSSARALSQLTTQIGVELIRILPNFSSAPYR